MEKYLLGSEKDFHDFVDSLKKTDKIGVVTHTDLDGIASAIFLQLILNFKGLKIDFLEFLNYGAEVLNPIIKRDFDVLFFTDWNADHYVEDLSKLREKGKVLVFDHHPFNKDLIDNAGIIKTCSDYCSTHALFDIAKSKNYFNTDEWKWLVSSTIVAEYTWDKSEDNFEFLKTIYPEIKKDSTIWTSKPGKIANLISNALIYYRPNFRKVYDLVLNKDLEKLEEVNKIISQEIDMWVNKAKKEAEYFPKQKLRFYFMNTKYGGTSKVASICSSRYFPEDTVVFVSDVKDGSGFVKMSARNQTGEIDLGGLLKKCVADFKNANAGGHVKAAAGSFPKIYLKEFKKNLLEELS